MGARVDRMAIPFVLETELERRIAEDEEWKKGIWWGKPRPAHPEGAVAYHIAEVLRNVDVESPGAKLRSDLRVISILHDTFKFRSPRADSEAPEQHHGEVARAVGERYLDDPAILDVIEFHDEAFVAWRLGMVHGSWEAAGDYVGQLVDALGPALPLYVHFIRCDNRTGDKIRDPVRWFEGYLVGRRIGVPPERLPPEQVL